jgi:hypothetical protein
MACLQEIIIQEDPSFSQEATLWEVKNTVLSGLAKNYYQK